jgi:hypothetical protein
MINILITIGNEILNSPFYSALASGFVISGVIGLLLPSYLLYLKRPKKLEFLFTESGRKENDFRINNQASAEYKFHLSFKNSSKGAYFKEVVYWHLFIPRCLGANVVSVEDVNKMPIRRDAGEGYEHFSGSVDYAIYPDLVRMLGYQFEVRLPHGDEPGEKLDSFVLYYYFGTEFGLYPNSVKIDFDLIQCSKLSINFKK